MSDILKTTEDQHVQIALKLVSNNIVPLLTFVCFSTDACASLSLLVCLDAIATELEVVSAAFNLISCSLWGTGGEGCITIFLGDVETEGFSGFLGAAVMCAHLLLYQKCSYTINSDC